MNKLLLFTIFTILFVSTAFAQTERDRGIELYKQGKNSEAIKVLKKAGKQKQTENDAEVWNVLGLAYIRDNEVKEARKSFDKAVELDIQNSDYRSNLAYAYLLEGRLNVASGVAKKAVELDYQNKFAYYTLGLINMREGNYEESLENLDKVLSIDEKFSSAYLLKSKIYIRQNADLSQYKTNADNPAFLRAETYKNNRLDLLKKSADALETCIKICKDSDLKTAKEELKIIQIFYNFFSRTKEDAQTENSNTKKFVIKSIPRAEYTNIARKNLVSGIITLAVLLSENGKDKTILVLKGLGFGLDEQAVKAAQQIEFEPKMKDGKPVPAAIQIQYSFIIY